MKLKASPVLFILIAALFFFGNLTASRAVVQHTLHHTQAQARSGENSNKRILAGALASKDLTEAARMGDKQGVASALQTPGRK
mgnify:CR=1 FL=1